MVKCDYCGKEQERHFIEVQDIPGKGFCSTNCFRKYKAKDPLDEIFVDKHPKKKKKKVVKK